VRKKELTMKLMTHKTILLTLMTFSLVMTASPLTAQVYKVVDENGNVTYTDRPPADGSKPVDLPPLSIIEAPVYEKSAKQLEAEAIASGELTPEIPLKTLRRNYQGFAIVSPQSEESVWHPEGPVPIAWSAGAALQDGMKVTIFIDGSQHATTTEAIIPVAGLERGEHTVTAELKDAKNRRIATAEPVTFFIRQPGLYNRARVGRGGPGGGG